MLRRSAGRVVCTGTHIHSKKSPFLKSELELMRARYFVSAVQAYVPTTHRGLVILGDSITDGRGSDDNKNNRWPDLLLARMQTNNHSDVAVLNQAAGGNCVLSQCLGPSLVSRYKRDGLEQPGVKYLMIFEGVNDIGNGNGGSTADQLISAFKQIAADAKKAGMTTIGATITPLGTSYYNAAREQARLKVNTWIMQQGNFDVAVDFAGVVANAGNKAQMDSKYNSGDGLHPNVAGYTAMAAAFPLEVFNS